MSEPDSTAGDPVWRLSPGDKWHRSDDGGTTWEPVAMEDVPEGARARAVAAALTLGREFGAWREAS